MIPYLGEDGSATLIFMQLSVSDVSHMKTSPRKLVLFVVINSVHVGSQWPGPEQLTS